MVALESNYSWRDAVMKRLEELIRLEHGWDGYKGEPVSLENAVFVLGMLEAVCGPVVPSPQLVPGVSGDVQVEWHNLKGSIEIHVLAPNHVHAWRRLVGVDEDGDGPYLTSDFRTVAAWIKDMTEPDLAAATADARVERIN